MTPAEAVGSPEGPAYRALSLGGHRFTPSVLVPDPFIRTSLRTSLGAGTALALTLPQYTLGGDPPTGVEGDIVLANLALSYQQSFNRRMSMLFEYAMQGQLGTGARTLILRGVTAATRSKVGWLVRVWGNERALVSASATVTNQSATVVDILGFVEGVIDSGGLTPGNRIVRSVPTTDGRGGARFAYGFGRSFGLAGLFETGYGESLERGTGNQWFTSGGATLSLDLSEIASIPLGITLGGYGSSLSSSLDENVEGQQALILGLGYVGRSDFDLGLEATYQRNPQEKVSQPFELAFVQLTMRYYF
jgi:hypothetical protein